MVRWEYRKFRKRHKRHKVTMKYFNVHLESQLVGERKERKQEEMILEEIAANYVPKANRHQQTQQIL